MQLANPETFVLTNADDYLGPSTSRYFGSGYRNTTPALNNLCIRHAPGGPSTVEATGSLGIGSQWSTKGTTTLVPHLGTTDAIVLALEATEVLLASRYSKELLSDVYVTEVSIRAGREPMERQLDEFPVKATMHDKAHGSGPTVTVKVGTMHVAVAVHRPLSVAGNANVRSPGPDTLLGQAGRRVYGNLYKSRQSTIRDITVSGQDARATATVDVSTTIPLEGHIGLEANYQPGLSLLEAFVTTLQMGQILLYELDSLRRADSSTLWMRRTTIKTSGPPPTTNAPLALDVHLERQRLLALNDEDWRCADINGRIGNHLTISCDVAHKLP